MQPFSFWGGGGGSYQRLLRRLDHAADQINPFLAIIAIGLAILNAACLVALLYTASLAIRGPDPCFAVSAPVAPAVPNGPVSR
jgi:hypothetical protein